MAFSICFIDACPVHKVPLEEYKFRRPVPRKDYRLSVRDPLVREIDEESTVLVDQIRKMIGLTTTVEPMREARRKSSRFSWIVAGIMENDGSNKHHIRGRTTLHNIKLTGRPNGLYKTNILHNHIKAIYYQELNKINAEVALRHQQHLPACRLRERLLCGICNAYDSFSHSSISPSSRKKFYRWLGNSLWPSLQQLEQWFLTPVLDQWIVPQATLESVEPSTLRILIHHELKRLLYAHILHGMFLERFPDQGLRRALFVEAYQEGWPGACVVYSLRRQLVLPEIRIGDIFAIDSEKFLLFKHL